MRGEGDEEKENRELNAIIPVNRCLCLRANQNPLQNYMRVRLPSTMSRKDGQLEGRLDDLLSRIAMETQEIKELEQQLTSNQILANEALQRDLQEATTGLQEYLRGLRLQARRSQQQVHVLQAENQSLRRLLQDSHTHCRMVQDPQEELSALWMEVQALRVRQEELEAELQQLRAEPALQVQLDQFNPTRIQLERLPDSLTEPENQMEPQDGASSTDSLSAERLHGSAHQNRTSRQEVQLGQNQMVEQNLASSLASQGTQDSGLELQYLSSPDRGRHQEELPSGGYFVSDTIGRVGSQADDAFPAGRIRLAPNNPNEVVSAGTSQGPPAGGRMSRCRDKGGRCVSDCMEEKKKMQRSLRQHRSVLQVCDELGCLEETLLQRRAELRQADRLLLEAQSCRLTARRDADSLQHQLDNSATCLLEATRHLREMQEGTELLRRKREEEEQCLRKMEKELRSRQEELQQLGSKVTRAANRLADLLSDCREAQECLDYLSCQVSAGVRNLQQGATFTARVFLQKQRSIWLPGGSRELEDRRRRTDGSGTRKSCPSVIF